MDERESTVHRHMREMLNELNHKCSYRTDIIDELTALVELLLRQENERRLKGPTAAELCSARLDRDILKRKLDEAESKLLAMGRA